MSAGEEFASIMKRVGVKIHKSVLLGKYLHIDTNKCEEDRVRSALAKMGVKDVIAMEPGEDGTHLDGSRHHRIVAVFQ